MIVYVLKSKNGYIGQDNDIIYDDYQISFGYNQAHYGKYIKGFLGVNILAFPNKEAAWKFKDGLANRDIEIERYFTPNYADNLLSVIGNTAKTMYTEAW